LRDAGYPAPLAAAAARSVRVKSSKRARYSPRTVLQLGDVTHRVSKTRFDIVLAPLVGAPPLCRGCAPVAALAGPAPSGFACAPIVEFGGAAIVGVSGAPIAFTVGVDVTCALPTGRSDVPAMLAAGGMAGKLPHEVFAVQAA
jgi:hypothetical protein